MGRPANRQLVYAPEGLYTATEIQEKLQISKFKLHQWIKRGQFPRCLQRKEDRSGLARFWRKEVVEQWIIDNQNLLDIQKEKKKNSGLDLDLPKKHEVAIKAACKLCDCTLESFILDAALTKARRVLDHYDFTENKETCFVGAYQHGRFSKNSKTVNTR